MWEQSSGSNEEKSAQILATLKIIESGNEETFEILCKKFKDSKDEIIKNRELINEILFGQHLLLGKMDLLSDKIDEVHDDVKVTSEKLDVNAEKLDKIYEAVQSSGKKIENNEYGNLSQNDPNTFVGSTFSISWPENWFKVDDEAQELIKQQMLEEYKNGTGEDLGNMPTTITLIKSHMESYPAPPSVTLMVSPSKGYGFKEIFQKSIKEFEDAGLTIVKTHLDEMAEMGTTEFSATIQGTTLFYIQKSYLRGDLFYMLSVACNEGQLDKEPDLVNEIKIITQSLNFFN